MYPKMINNHKPLESAKKLIRMKTETTSTVEWLTPMQNAYPMRGCRGCNVPGPGIIRRCRDIQTRAPILSAWKTSENTLRIPSEYFFWRTPFNKGGPGNLIELTDKIPVRGYKVSIMKFLFEIRFVLFRQIYHQYIMKSKDDVVTSVKYDT